MGYNSINDEFLEYVTPQTICPSYTQPTCPTGLSGDKGSREVLSLGNPLSPKLSDPSYRWRSLQTSQAKYSGRSFFSNRVKTVSLSSCVRGDNRLICFPCQLKKSVIAKGKANWVNKRKSDIDNNSSRGSPASVVMRRFLEQGLIAPCRRVR